MNFVCIVFELGDKMLTLSSMENLIVQCNLYKGQLMRLTLSWFFAYYFEKYWFWLVIIPPFLEDTRC